MLKSDLFQITFMFPNFKSPYAQYWSATKTVVQQGSHMVLYRAVVICPLFHAQQHPN